MKIAICFLTNNNVNMWFTYQALIDNTEKCKNHKIDVFKYINDESQNCLYSEKTKNEIIFKFEYFRNKYNWYYEWNNSESSVGKFTGCEFLPWLDMYDNHKNEYDFFMFYEDDLFYRNKNISLFDRIDFNCDFLFQDKLIPVDESYWSWYHNPEIGKYELPYTSDKIFHQLLNIYGGNRKTIEYIKEFMKKYYMMHEGLICTCIMNSNYKINYISNYIKTYFTYKINNMINFLFKIKYENIELVHPVKKYHKSINDY